MGWRFRRTLSLGGFRWTASKSGVGASWGLGGILRFGVSPAGQRYVSMRIPGTGVSWVKYYGGRIVSGGSQGTPAPSSPSSLPQPPSQPPNPTPASQPWWKQTGP
jgi:hypothetical protein